MRSKRWRSDENEYDDKWRRMSDLYMGKQYDQLTGTDQLIVNLAFSTINTLAPAVAVNNPRFTVNARNPDGQAQAVITEEVLNYVWQTYKYQDDFRLSVLDWLIIGHGWAKVGYKVTKPAQDRKVDAAQVINVRSSAIVSAGSAPDDGKDYGIDDREDVPGNVESEMNVPSDADRPFVERISPFDMFVEPEARHPKELAWIAQRVWRPVADVMVDSRYETAARKVVTGKSWSRWSTSDATGDARDEEMTNAPKAYCEVIEFYDLKRDTVCTFALSAETTDGYSAFLIKPQPMPYAMGQPFRMLRGFEIPDHFYTMGDLEQVESLQLELNETRTQMMNHRKRFQRKWLYDKDAFDRDGVAALESDIDNTMIPVMSDGNPGNTIAALPAVITPSDFYDQSGLITNDIDRITGVNEYARGAAQQNIKRTATEAAMIQDASNSRAQDRLAKIETFLAQLGEAIIGLMQQYMTGEQVARIVTMPGATWINYDPEYIQGEFDYSVAAGSTQPQNETFRRQSAMQLVDASMPFLQMGVANPLGVYMYVLQNGFGIKDVENFINRASQMGGPPPDPNAPPGAQQGAPPQASGPPSQGPPPGGPGGGGPAPVPQGPPPGGPEQVPPQGAPQIPPEILQAMMAQGGSPPGPGGGPPPQVPPEMLQAMMAQGGPPGPAGGPPQIPPEILQALMQQGGPPPPR